MIAQQESRRLKHNFVGSEQILVGLIGEGSGIAAKILNSYGVNWHNSRVQVEQIIGFGNDAVAEEIPFTPRAKRILEFALEESRKLGHGYQGTEHLLLAIIRDGEGVANRVLENLGLDTEELKLILLAELGDPAACAYLDKKRKLERFNKLSQLYQILSSLPPPQFNRVVFGLEVPSGNIPSATSPQADRVSALVEWAGSPIGCGLEHLEEVLKLVLTSK